MKVFLSVDMEGISGLVRWADVVTQGLDFARNRRFMTLDTNAAIEGAFEAGATQVVVEENHGVEELCDLVLDEIDPRCTVVRGAGRPTATTMAGLDSACDVVLFVGHHARAGSFPGIMAHTVSYGTFRSVRIAGQPVGETDLFAIRAGELGVPVGLITGDQIVIEELRKRAPWIETAQVKTALSNVSGEIIPPARARGLIRTAAVRAVERAKQGDLRIYTGEPAPYPIEVEFREPVPDELRANLEQLPEFRLIDDKTVATEAPDMDLGFRRIAYLSFGNRAGLTRY